MSERSNEKDVLAAPVTAVLDDHRVIVTFDGDPPVAATLCACGFKDSLSGTQPNEHLARQVEVAIERLVRERMEQAWDEGYEARRDEDPNSVRSEDNPYWPTSPAEEQR